MKKLTVGVILLIIIILIFRVFFRSSFPESKIQVALESSLQNALAKSKAGDKVSLGELTPNRWQYVCIFGGYSGVDTINKGLGRTWLHSFPHAYSVPENSTLLVFIGNGQVYEHAEIPNRLISPGSKNCYRYPEAIFEVKPLEPGSEYKTLYPAEGIK